MLTSATDSPRLYQGLITDWPAYELWRQGRLLQLAAEQQVPFMVSCNNNQFIGDMRHMCLLERPLRAMFDGSLGLEAAAAVGAHANTNSNAAPSSWSFYLAQCPIAVKGSDGQLQPGPLYSLLQDIKPPQISKSFAQISFWASFGQGGSKSSLHYDPHHNLLCVVNGNKTVTLAPPCVTTYLSAHKGWAESINHAAANLTDTTLLQQHPELVQYVQQFTLESGDALFIPEGWWHQVESTTGTLAVNFWWDSDTSEALFAGTGDNTDNVMAEYYFKRLGKSLMEKKKRQLLDTLCKNAACYTSGGQQDEASVEAHAFSDLLVLLPTQQGNAQGAIAQVETIICGLFTTNPQSLLRVLSQLAELHPQQTKTLLLDSFTPACWELLTSGIEGATALQASAHIDEQSLEAFYDKLYDAVGDRQLVLDTMLSNKETLSRQLMQQVVDKLLV